MIWIAAAELSHPVITESMWLSCRLWAGAGEENPALGSQWEGKEEEEGQKEVWVHYSLKVSCPGCSIYLPITPLARLTQAIGWLKGFFLLFSSYSTFVVIKRNLKSFYNLRYWEDEISRRSRRSTGGHSKTCNTGKHVALPLVHQVH